jgi:hypothetical protein
VHVAVRFRPRLDREGSRSDSSESEGVDFGEMSSILFKIRSYAVLVRSIGPPLSNFPLFVGLPDPPCDVSSLVFLGSVRAQFSHGIARFLSFSSYVLRKLESRRWRLPFRTIGSAANLGL